MATLNATVLSLLDWAKRIDPKGKTAPIAELLSQDNPVLADMVFMEGNLPTGHRTTVRTGLPTVAWRLLNGGIAPSKSTTAQLDEQCGELGAYSEVDVELARLNGDAGAFRLSEGSAFVEAMQIEAAQTLFYGNSGTAPEEFTGLSPRYSSLSAGNASNIITGSGVGTDNSSVWLVCWGSKSIHGIFPNGSKAGLMHKDLGEVTIESTGGIGAGTRMQAYRDYWQWKLGIALRDWRYVVRMPNIDISNLVAKSAAADLTEMMIKAIHRIPNNMAGSKPVFYMNRTCFQMLDIQRRDDVIAGGGLTYENVDGKITAMFRGIPVRKCDALLETEDLVS